MTNGNCIVVPAAYYINEKTGGKVYDLAFMRSYYERAIETLVNRSTPTPFGATSLEYIVIPARGYFTDDNEIVYDLEAMQEEFETEIKELTIGEKYGRKCDITGEGMLDGFYIEFSAPDSPSYIANESDLVAFIRKVEIQEALDDNDEQRAEDMRMAKADELKNLWYEQELYYWTEWTDEDDMQYQMINGELVKIQ